MSAARVTEFAASARSERRRPSGMAAPAPLILGRVRRAASRSPTSPPLGPPPPGIRRGGTVSPPSCAPRWIDGVLVVGPAAGILPPPPRGRGGGGRVGGADGPNRG